MHGVEPTLIYQWPQLPSLPPPGRAVLVRVATPQPRQAARHEMRTVLRQTLADWSHLPPEQLPLDESPRGPIWQGAIGGEMLDINLSYSTEESWLGLIRGGWIGVDVALVSPFAEADDVAQCYLGPETAAGIRNAANPARAFAVAWTEREARLKCLKLGLTEWTPTRAADESICHCQNLVLSDTLVGAVCWRY